MLPFGNVLSSLDALAIWQQEVKMFDPKRAVRASACVLLAACLGVGLARAQQQEYINFGSGEGTLEYTVTYTSGPCGQYWTYQEWQFTSLVYVDPNGNNVGLGGGGAYYSSTGSPQQGCPPSGAYPAQINYGSATAGFVINWFPGQGQGSANVAFTGSVNPNYEVAGAFYAPPGSKSYADYSQTTMVGASTTMSSSFQSSVSQSVTYGYTGGSIFGTSSYSNTAGSSLSQQQDSSSSIDISYQKTQGYKILGPSSDLLGLYHPADQLAVWLNPVANLNLTPGAVDWTSYSWDGRDPAHNIEIVYLTVYELENPSYFQNEDPTTWGYVEKTAWNPSGGLTDTDFSNIAAQDPYSNASPAPDTTRYQGPVNGSTIPYKCPGCPSCQPSTWYWNTNYQVTNTQGQGAQWSYSLNFGISATYQIFGGLFSADLKSSDTLSWTSKWSSTETQKVTQAATVSITGPASCSYTGPTEFNMYQDNVYGTYMFYPRQ
jgi:hypothetical protein